MPLDLPDFATEKIGPMPVWGYGVVLVGATGVFIYMRKRGGSGASSDGQTVYVQPDDMLSPFLNTGGAGGGSTSGGGTTPVPEPETPAEPVDNTDKILAALGAIGAQILAGMKALVPVPAAPPAAPPAPAEPSGSVSAPPIYYPPVTAPTAAPTPSVPPATSNGRIYYPPEPAIDTRTPTPRNTPASTVPVTDLSRFYDIVRLPAGTTGIPNALLGPGFNVVQLGQESIDVSRLRGYNAFRWQPLDVTSGGYWVGITGTIPANSLVGLAPSGTTKIPVPDPVTGKLV